MSTNAKSLVPQPSHRWTAHNTDGCLVAKAAESCESDERLDALINAQIELTERLNTLTRDIAALGHRFDQMAIVTNEQIKAIIKAQEQTGEQIRLLIDLIGRPEGSRAEVAGEGSDKTRFAELPDWLTVREVALWLRKPTSAIYDWVRTGRIPCVRVGRSCLFSKAALIDWARPNYREAEIPETRAEKLEMGERRERLNGQRDPRR
jgi:excisionase family DNA binding protein